MEQLEKLRDIEFKLKDYTSGKSKDGISKDEALLLMGAILDNTLNFKARVTTQRDIDAYNLLKEKADIENFDEVYLKECEKDLLKDISGFVKLETNVGSGTKLPMYFSQIVFYDKGIINDKYQIIADELEKNGDDWIINIIDLKEGKSYIFSTNLKPQEKMEKIFNKKFDDRNLLDLGNLYLRKEIIKLAKGIE